MNPMYLHHSSSKTLYVTHATNQSITHGEIVTSKYVEARNCRTASESKEWLSGTIAGLT